MSNDQTVTLGAFITNDVCANRCGWFDPRWTCVLPFPEIPRYVCPKCGSKIAAAIGRFEVIRTVDWMGRQIVTYGDFIEKGTQYIPQQTVKPIMPESRSIRENGFSFSPTFAVVIVLINAIAIVLLSVFK